MMGKHPEYDRSTFPFIRLGQINADPVTKMEGTTITIKENDTDEIATTSNFDTTKTSKPDAQEEATPEVAKEQPLDDFWENLLENEDIGSSTNPPTQTETNDIITAMTAAGITWMDGLQDDIPLD
jgi:hypothetical protein